ncbi:hypothetical protein F5X68DRAFT_290 [Plectosphaerella plurivora]|uniref:Uncharacterized protein n=1 Tax=Plectosphaerella plurivora TaxID=936078 RepID=A0A9P9AF92_9PEZI|nr:hypothetical protein F5X68DRAFT_290 [Plectosphaerella plurivora]
MAVRKRARDESPAAVHDDEPRRRSRRISSTPKKSMYFEDEDDDDPEDADAGYKDQESDSEEEEVEEDEEEERPVKRSRGRPVAKVVKAAVAKKPTKAKPSSTQVKKRQSEVVEDDYEDNGTEEEDADEDDDEDDEDKPPRVTIIPHEKLRSDGGVEYDDEKVHKNTLLFLADLKANNQRPWLKSHDGEYRRALQDWNTFVGSLTPKIIDIDFTIPELPAKDVVFRIHRDIRFSKDPTPYKPHFSAAWSRTGRKGPYACYYIHAEPNGHCFVGGGLWHPPGEQLQLLRESIDERPARWRRVLNEERFRRVFLESKMKTKKGKKGGGNDDAEASLLAFAASNQENALKTKPKGYLADHRDIELLKLRNFTIGIKVEDDIYTKDDAQEKLLETIQAMEPFITFLNSIVMPDPNAEDSSDEDQDGDEEANGNKTDADESDD